MKKRLEHLWFYYKWYLITGAVVLALAVNFISAKVNRQEPDHQVAVVTGAYISEETRERLGTMLEALWDDANGDGEVVVNVNFYQYDANAMDSANTASFMASAVQLAADFQAGISVCFFTDCPELLMENAELTVFISLEDSCLAELTELRGFTVLAYEKSAELEKIAAMN